MTEQFLTRRSTKTVAPEALHYLLSNLTSAPEIKVRQEEIALVAKFINAIRS